MAAKFCNACGAKLRTRCAQCGHENPPGSRFCNECGVSLFAGRDGQGNAPTPVTDTPHRLAGHMLAEQAAVEASAAPQDERKTVTALFADIKGSMELIEDLDPEAARHIIDPALQLMMDAVHRYEGYVAQSTGDGIFALFGAPLAHEDHAQRALYAALQMQEGSKRYAERLRLEKGINLQIRVGVNTGEVVVRSLRKDDRRAEYVPVGHATSLAARMESLALPGSILVSDHTYKLTEGYFAFKALGKTRVKGVTEPLRVYEVVGIGPLRTRLQVAARQGLVPFIGRQSELTRLKKALEQADAGHGQIVGVMGEPGVGKSRLFFEFKELFRQKCLVLEAFALSHGKTYPSLPLIDLLKHYFQITVQDNDRKRQEKVLGKVLTLDRDLEDTLPYLFFLLGVSPLPAALAQMDPQVRRLRTFTAIKRLLVRESLNQPLMLIFEDLHWVDSETQAFLDTLSESIPSARILLLVNYRLEYQHPWGNKTFYTHLRLDPLSPEDAEAFLSALLQEKGGAQRIALLQDLKRFILEKTEGNPFFMEEIVQTLVEQQVLPSRSAVETGWKPVPTIKSASDLRLPATVQTVLASRIDRLPREEKDLLQTLAVIGREFSLKLLRRVADRSEDTLQQLLARLQAAEFVYEQPTFPEGEYTFKHGLTQEVAYNSILLERRKLLHERAAQALEELYDQHLEDHYSELAHHYVCSGNNAMAVKYLQHAGQQAAQRSAHAEATRHLTSALELIPTLPDEPGRARQELGLHLAFAASLQATKGPAAPEVERAYLRAHALCRETGEAPQLFAALRGLWLLHHVRAELATARELGEQLLSMAERTQESTLLLEAHRALGSTLLWQGNFPRALVHLEQGMTLSTSQRHRSFPFLQGGADPGVSCLCEAARALWFLGYPDQALRRSQAALELAQERSDPFSLGFSLVFAAGLHQLRREGQAAQKRAEEAITFAGEQGFASLLSAGTIRRGWALAAQGQAEEGLKQMQQGLTARQTAGAELAQPYFLALQAEVYGKVGQREKALSLLAQALAAVHSSGERRLEAELYRLKGQLLLQPEARGWRPETSSLSSQASNLKPLVSREVEREAEECFLKAVEIARQQSAKSLELRAVVSLCRLWKGQGKAEQAQQMLAEIYDWFTEGFDTADLREAKALLEELNHEVTKTMNNESMRH